MQVNTLALPSFVLGYHGTDRRTADRVLSGEESLQPSEEDYDWLGHGVYFWEHNPVRAMEWASRDKRLAEPAVIGAVLDLGTCFNLLDASCLSVLAAALRTFGR